MLRRKVSSPGVGVVPVVVVIGNRPFPVGLDVRADAWDAKCSPLLGSVPKARRYRLAIISVPWDTVSDTRWANDSGAIDAAGEETRCSVHVFPHLAQVIVWLLFCPRVATLYARPRVPLSESGFHRLLAVHMLAVREMKWRTRPRHRQVSTVLEQTGHCIEK